MKKIVHYEEPETIANGIAAIVGALLIAAPFVIYFLGPVPHIGG